MPPDVPGGVLVTSRSFGSGQTDPAATLREAGLAVARGQPDHDITALEAELTRAVGWIAGTGQITASHLDLAPHLRVIARYGTGTDAVDLDAAAARGITVTNTPGANSESVADHTIALSLAVLRQVVAGDGAVRGGDLSTRRGRELGSLTAGLVGFGSVGQAVARRLRGFGNRILAHDPYAPQSAFDSLHVQRVSDLDALFSASELVSLHRPGGQTLVTAAELRRLPPGATLINTARADLIDEADVASALLEGTLAAFGSDVLDATRSPLLHAPGVVLTPHVAAQTDEAIDRMGTIAATEVERVLAGRPPRNPVVAPAVSSPPQAS